MATDVENQRRLRLECRSLCRDIDANRWRLAKKARLVKKMGVPNWNEIMSIECRRSPSTIYGWADADELRLTVGGSYKLAISFWTTAAEGLTEGNLQERIDWIMQCEADETITLESARANFPRKPKPEPPAPTLRETLMQIGVQVQDAYDATTIGAIRGLLADVKRDLKMAADWAAESEAIAPDAEQVRV